MESSGIPRGIRRGILCHVVSTPRENRQESDQTVTKSRCSPARPTLLSTAPDGGAGLAALSVQCILEEGRNGCHGEGSVRLFYWVTFFFFWPERKSLSPQEKKHDMKKVLDYRWEELQFLLEERGRVDSLLKLCEAAKPWVQGDSHPTCNHQAAGSGRSRWERARGLLSEGGFCNAVILSKAGRAALCFSVFPSCPSPALFLNMCLLIAERKGGVREKHQW